jgi:hypothetical protein
VKLKQPEENPRSAFCSRGFHASFYPGGLRAQLYLTAVNESCFTPPSTSIGDDCLAVNEAGFHQGGTCMAVAPDRNWGRTSTATLPLSPVFILNEIAASGMDFAFSPDQN